MSTTNILDLNNRIDELEKNSGGGSADSAKRSDIATEFSTGTNYTAGNFVYYEGKLYQFNADHSAGAWDPTDVAEANVTDQIVSNASAIAGLTASDVSYGVGTSVADALDKLQVESGTFNITSGYFINSTVNYKKLGNVVTIFFNLKASTSISSNTIIGVVPDGLKPSYPISVKSTQGDYGLYVYENGNISTLGSINDTAWVYATLTYII